MSIRSDFSNGDLVVYPNHGVGVLEDVDTETIAGQTIDVLVIHFKQNRMTLRLPLAKAKNTGLRSVCSEQEIDSIFTLLTKKVKPTKGIWARRAQEYETKINSGRLSSLSEVIRELHSDNEAKEQSYSERQIYQTAFERLASEICAVKSIEYSQACDEISKMLKTA